MKQLLAIVLLLASTPLLAIGTSAPEVHSALGEPLLLIIPISGTSDLTDQQMQFSLADLETYKKLGITFEHSHQLLRFEAVRDENNDTTLKVTTREPIHEPYLHFVLRIKTPTNQLIKDVPVLLDTPEL